MTEIEYRKLLIDSVRAGDYPEKDGLLELLNICSLRFEKTNVFTRNLWNHFQEYIHICIVPEKMIELKKHADYLKKMIYEIYPPNDDYELWGVEIKPGAMPDTEDISQEILFENIRNQIIEEIRAAKYMIWISVAWFTDPVLYQELQYIQFLEKELKELELSSVLYTMLVKTYVITGIGIIEGIFSYVIKSNGWWKTNDEEVVLNSTSQQKSKEGDMLVVRVEISRKISPYNDRMTFDEMLKCLKHHHKALSVDHLLYPQLDRIRDLRNRVHLQKGEGEKDHDYNAFDYSTKDEMQRILYNVLCSPKVTDPRVLHNYDFLKPQS